MHSIIIARRMELRGDGHSLSDGLREGLAVVMLDNSTNYAAPSATPPVLVRTQWVKHTMAGPASVQLLPQRHRCT